MVLLNLVNLVQAELFYIENFSMRKDLKDFLDKSKLFSKKDVTSSDRPNSKNKLSRHRIKGGAIDLRIKDKDQELVRNELEKAVKSGMEVEYNISDKAPHAHLGSAQVGRPEGSIILVDNKKRHKIPTNDLLKIRDDEMRKFKKEDEIDNTVPPLLARREQTPVDTIVNEIMEAKQLQQGVALTQTNEGKQVAKKLIREEKQLNPYQKNRIEKQIENPNKQAEIVLNENSNNNNKPSVTNSFLEALTFMIPTALGAGVGAVIDGGEGAVAGAEYAGNLQKSFIDYKTKQQELRNKQLTIENNLKAKPKTIQQSGFIDKNTGEPAIFDPNTGIYKTSSGRVISSKDLKEGVQGRFEAKAAEVSDKQQDAIKAVSETSNAIKRIKELKPKVNTGAFISPYQSSKEVFGLADKEFTELKTEVKSVSNNYIKAITGAQMSEAEAERLMAVIPQIDDDDNVFNTKLETFEKIINANKDALLESIKSGQPLKRETINKMLKSLDKKSPPTNKPLMSDEQRSRLQELKNKYRK